MVTPIQERTRTRQRLDDLDIPEPLLRIDPPSDTPREISTASLVAAMAVWMFGVFGIAYIALPLLLLPLTGSVGQLLIGPIFNLPGFVLATFVAMVTAAAWRPKIVLDIRAAADPVIAAAAGGLLTWATVHNTSPLLRHFDQFGALELAGFAFINVVEMSLIGMMLASFTRSRWVAFALGAGFQLLALGLILTVSVL